MSKVTLQQVSGGIRLVKSATTLDVDVNLEFYWKCWCWQESETTRLKHAWAVRQLKPATIVPQMQVNIRAAVGKSTAERMDGATLFSQKVFLTSFCKSRFPQKFVNVPILMTYEKNKLTDL